MKALQNKSERQRHTLKAITASTWGPHLGGGKSPKRIRSAIAYETNEFHSLTKKGQGQGNGEELEKDQLLENRSRSVQNNGFSTTRSRGVNLPT